MNNATPHTPNRNESVVPARPASGDVLTGDDLRVMSSEFDSLVNKLYDSGTDLERTIDATHDRISSLAASVSWPRHEQPLPDSVRINSGSKPPAVLPRDLHSLQFLQTWLSEATLVLGKRIAVFVTNKRGKVFDLGCIGWDSSLLRINRELIGNIAKKAIIRGGALCSVQPVNQEQILQTDTSASAAEPILEDKPLVADESASLCASMNRLSRSFDSPLTCIALELPQSSGFAVLVMDTSAGIGNRLSAFKKKGDSREWSDIQYLKREIDDWFLIKRCRWSIRWTERVEWVRANPKKLLIPIGVLLSGLLLPVPYYPRRDCVFEPEVRQYISSPVAGRIVVCNVRPGDRVEKGQLLAQLDGEQMLRDLSTAQAELEGATKKLDTAIATRTAGEMGIAKVDIRLAQTRIDSLQDQLSRLDVRALADGTVVQGDWKRSIGMPVTLGQNLFEIAEMESMTVEVHLNAHDLGQIKVGDKVSVRSDATGGTTFQGSIGRIEPRASIIDQQTIFIADVIIEDSNMQLRPGMKATAQIEAGWRSIGWLLFSKPYRWLANQWIW
ncbi:MAG: efflux RND transporter periplasmic adaptor subunit [Pirellula sp.]|nr:efflux RND transporter periplasmic adaptor subunit [Pirellula sp.]